MQKRTHGADPGSSANLEKSMSDLKRLDALADAGRALHEGKLTEAQFREKLFDLGVCGRDADLEFFYNHPSNKEWAGAPDRAQTS